MHLTFGLGTDTSIKGGGAKLFLWTQTSAMMRSCKCFPYVSDNHHLQLHEQRYSKGRGMHLYICNPP